MGGRGGGGAARENGEEWGSQLPLAAIAEDAGIREGKTWPCCMSGEDRYDKGERGLYCNESHTRAFFAATSNLRLHFHLIAREVPEVLSVFFFPIGTIFKFTNLRAWNWGPEFD